MFNIWVGGKKPEWKQNLEGLLFGRLIMSNQSITFRSDNIFFYFSQQKVITKSFAKDFAKV